MNFKAHALLMLSFVFQNKSLTLGIDALNKNETSFTGNCSASNVTQTLTVTFYKTSTLAMTFTKDGENSYLSNLDLSIDLTNELFPDAKTPGNYMICL